MKKIFKYSAVCILLTSASLVSGQAKVGCTSQEDPFTGKQTVFYLSDIYSNVGMKLLENGNVELTIRVTFAGDQDVTIAEGTPIGVKLGDGTLLERPTLRDVPSIEQALYNQIASQYFLPIEVTVAELEKFGSEGISFLRYPDLKGDYISQEIKGMIKGKYKKWLAKGAKCITKNIE